MVKIYGANGQVLTRRTPLIVRPQAPIYEALTP
jgi:hypothetical protein